MVSGVVDECSIELNESKQVSCKCLNILLEDLHVHYHIVRTYCNVLCALVTCESNRISVFSAHICIDKTKSFYVTRSRNEQFSTTDIQRTVIGSTLQFYSSCIDDFFHHLVLVQTNKFRLKYLVNWFIIKLPPGLAEIVSSLTAESMETPKP